MNPRHTSMYSLLALLLAAGLITACGNFGSFTFTEESQEIEVEGQSSPLSNLLPTEIPMQVNLQQELERQDASGAESVHLIDLHFEMTENTDEEHFDFMDEITITVDADNQSEEELAWNLEIPEGQDRFHLDTDSDLDLKPYVEEGMSLETDVSGSAPNDDARFKVYAEYRVHVL